MALQVPARRKYVTRISQSLDGVGPYFGIPNAPCLKTVPVRSALFSVTRIDRAVANGEVVEIAMPPSDSYFLMLYLENTAHADIGRDGSRSPVRRFAPGTICLINMRYGASIALHSSLCSLAFTLPRPLFEEVSQLSTASSFRSLHCQRGEPDPVISNLGIAFVPLFGNGQLASSALLQHMAVAVCAHLLHDYHSHEVDLEETHFTAAGLPLATWQEDAAKTFMRNNLGSHLSITAIAAATGLSANHFSQRFKKTTGFTPHQWLLKIRVERAKEMLANRSYALKAIAGQCGFCDQSHFTKTFVRHTGLTPTAWRSGWIH
ncbi:AraC family transcriptional regulator (plasmid) [Rhizobium sp. T1470]|uniref:helix-turn-helix domain-containing protein n=1 Tax=unclassified Rhizobium TaxID=2613769 RepID=UPI001AAF8E40|nr:AraC family transcriptional regulator [Rhizobium sp. T1473]MCA0805607.1 AraC family transcriptional regulator [Rhizobium sp. T1473]